MVLLVSISREIQSFMTKVSDSVVLGVGVPKSHCSRCCGRVANRALRSTREYGVCSGAVWAVGRPAPAC